MSLYGALFSGVSGLRSQSTKIGIISDNIANTNTVGYKGGQGVFESLVTGSGSGTAFSPGGVLGGNRQLISKQGLLQATDSPTDIAISGAGFFVVNKTSDGTGQVLYTRAGSFTQDSTGNFRNAAGFFLQAWPLDPEGRLPGEPGNITNTSSSANLSSLRTVNVQNLTGAASPTTNISLGANLDAGQSVFPGAAGIVDMDAQDTVNSGINGTNLIVPQPAGTLDRLSRGDIINIATGANTVGFDYTYGGFTFSRSVTAGTGGDDGSGALGNGETTLGADPFTSIGGGSAVVTVAHAAHGFSTGDVVSFSGLSSDVGDISAAAINGESFVITVTGAGTYTITTAETDAGGASSGGGAAVVEDARPFAGQVLDATNASQTFLGTTGISNFTTASLSFSISTSEDTFDFTYTSSAPNAQLGQFNTLSNLADAINAASGLTARVSGNQLYVGLVDGTDFLTFANGSMTGVSGPPVQAGIDWIGELGLANVTALDNRFCTLEGLSAIVDASTDISATINNPLSIATVSINVDDPGDTIVFTDDAGNTGSVVSALGLGDPLAGAAFSVQTAGPFGPAYDPGDPTINMASGAITPQFSRPIQVFDALGTAHNLNVNFLKIAPNQWAVEIVATPQTDVNATPDIPLAFGNVTFNGDGSLNAVDSGLSDPITISWVNQSLASEITFAWGTAGAPASSGSANVGLTDGLSQFDSDFSVNFVNQNGSPVGALAGVSIDEEGFIIASFNNGATQRLYKIPLASFPNPDQLQTQTGNVFAQTSESGEVNLRQAGGSSAGKIASASLEASNVELADQLTDMIVAQRAYQANTKVISTADSLLEDLNRILQ